MASPVYFYGITAQMKTLIDRTVPIYAEISAKEFYFIITAADSLLKGLEKAVESFRNFIDCLPYSVEKGVIFAPGVWQVGEVNKTSFMQQAYEAGRNV